METYFLKTKDLFRFYEGIAGQFRLYVPVRIKSAPKTKCDYGFNLATDDYLLKNFSQIEDKQEIVFNEYRCIEPTRSFFTYAKDSLSDYFDNGKEKNNNQKPAAISGVKNCDIFSLKIQDFVFLGGNQIDSTYELRRQNSLIISSDCPNFKEACFCRAFDINPHVIEGFDFNMSGLDGGFLVDIGSEKAKEIAKDMKDILTSATEEQLENRTQNRNTVIKKIEEHLSFHKIPKKEILKDIVLSGYDSSVWQEQMLTCVECGGCVFICDTCHCFLITDTKSENRYKKIRLWDGCLYKNFAAVAGGINPLKMRYMRLRNRYLKKFDFFVDNIGFQACCGCGRCIEVCPGKIDIRYILRRLHEEHGEKHI